LKNIDRETKQKQNTGRKIEGRYSKIAIKGDETIIEKRKKTERGIQYQRKM
jgi:hypothetical protein